MWLAALSWMLLQLEATLPPVVEHLRQVGLCLAQSSKWGYRLSYCTWWNEQGRVNMRFGALAYKCMHHLVQVPLALNP